MSINAAHQLYYIRQWATLLRNVGDADGDRHFEENVGRNVSLMWSVFIAPALPGNPVGWLPRFVLSEIHFILQCKLLAML